MLGTETAQKDLDGRIIRLKLHNFLTYDDCEFQPGNNLNVILGPNGTGKSSIVCAICLGLGGKPDLLGRAKDIGDYVKHKTNEALIEIELYKSNGENIIVRRIIKKEQSRNADAHVVVKGTSVWEINGKRSSGNAVLETVAKLNIQMDNLCQFLPQDKVVEFARMSPQQTLQATEKAVGPPGMHDDHLQLIDLRQKLQQTKGSKVEIELAREHIETRNQHLERDVQRHKEREKHQEKIESLEKKKPWVQYEDARQNFLTVKKDKSDLERELSAARSQSIPMERQITKCKTEISKADAALKSMLDDGNKSVKIVKQINDKLDKQQEKIDEIKSELQVLQKEEDKRRQKIVMLQNEIVALQKDYEDAPNPETIKTQIEEINQIGKIKQEEMIVLDREGREVFNEIKQSNIQIQALKNHLGDLQNVDKQRLETLRQKDRHAYDAVMWLRENQTMFSGTVYEPIMTQITMKDVNNAAYVEAFIPFRDMTAFICESIEDQNLFSNQMRDVLKLNVSVVCPPKDAKNEYLPKNPLDELRQYGFQNYLTDLFTCPKTIYQYLCENYKLHNIPVGNKETERVAEMVIKNVHDMPKFCTPESTFAVKRSRYRNTTSTNVNPLRNNASLLNVGVDISEKNKLNAELAEMKLQHAEYTSRYEDQRKRQEQLKNELEELKKHKTGLLQQMRCRKHIATQIETKKKKLESGQCDAPDLQKEEEKVTRKICEINKTRVTLLKDYRDQIQKCVNIGKERIRLTMKQVQKRSELEKIERKLSEASESVKSLEEAYEVVSKQLLELKNQAKRLLNNAQAKTGTEGGMVSDELKDVFLTLPATVEEIEAMIHEEQARLNCQYQSNPGSNGKPWEQVILWICMIEYVRQILNRPLTQVLKDYEKNRKEINSLTEQIETYTKKIEEIQTDIGTLLERWLLPLEELISSINERYCEFFRRMGCAGQVTLEKDPDDDYKKFGIQIQVKFRAENKLRTLTSTFQSGGERSVSTMLYLISLQNLTKCPFRLVDEINQGMDPSNERRVFELVVETVCQPNTSQYFLITPKLLPDLKYTERMTILTVLNGHWMLPHHKLNIADCIQRRKAFTERSQRK